MTALAQRLVMTALLLGGAQISQAQTVDEIIEKHLAALGGRAALGKLTSRSMSGTLVLSTPGGDFTGPLEVLSQAPNKSRTFLTLDLTAAGLGRIVYDERFDGSTGHVIDTLQGNRDITGKQLDNLRNEVFPTPFLSYQLRGDTVELGGKEKVGDREAYVLILRPKSGPAMRRYLDVESHLEIRVVMSTSAPEVGEFEQIVDFLDQRDVDGVKVPFQIKGTSTVQTFTATITKVEHNSRIDQSLFSKPAD